MRVTASAAESWPNGTKQLATARLPLNCNERAFMSSLLQYVSNLTAVGSNLPWVYGVRADLVDGGFGVDVGFVRATDGNVFTEATVLLRIEDDVEQEGRRRVVATGVPQNGSIEDLQDVKSLMSALPEALRTAAASARSA